MNKKKVISRQPSLFKDLVASLFVTIFIVTSYIFIFYFFGTFKNFNTNITAFFGAILSLCGLMTKQYLFKETFDYLLKWIQIEKMLEEIVEHTNANDNNLKSIKNDLIEQKRISSEYSAYVKKELKIIPMIPILLVSFYGASLIANDSIFFRSICLVLMLYMVAYLAKAALSSNMIAIEKPDVEKLLSELTELKADIENLRTEPFKTDRW